MRHLGRLDRSLGEDLLDNLVLVGGAKDRVEVLLARALEKALRPLAGVENVEAVDDVDERDRAERTEARRQYAVTLAGVGLERPYRSAGRQAASVSFLLFFSRSRVGVRT